MKFFRNFYYYLAGLVLLYSNKLRYRYKPYTVSLYDPENEIQVFKGWLNALKAYTGAEKNEFICGNILEIGINKNISSALVGLALGAKKYDIVDFYPHHIPLDNHYFQELYDKLCTAVNEVLVISREQFLDFADLLQSGQNTNARILPMEKLDLNDILDESVDLIVSQAAFEHIENLENGIRQMSRVAKKGTVLIAEVDMKTHTRWLRDVDPLNIYRYEPSLYKFAGFSVMPNRIRPYQYKDLFEKNGWHNITIKVLEKLDLGSLMYQDVRFSKEFRLQKNCMEQLIVLICATKA